MHATCQVRVTIGDSGLSCCTCVNYFERSLTDLCVDFYKLVDMVVSRTVSRMFTCGLVFIPTYGPYA